MAPAATVNLAKLAGAFLPGRVALPGLSCSRPSIRSIDGACVEAQSKASKGPSNNCRSFSAGDQTGGSVC